MTAPIVEFHVPGRPIPQGSMAAITIGGKARIVHSRKTNKRESVQSWRKRVKHAARDAMPCEPIDGPVVVGVVFALVKPKSRRKRDLEPDTKPDLDKLVRALGDALEGTVVKQDSRITAWDARKVWASDVYAEGAHVRVSLP